jgi:hypothetical protein
MVRGVQVDLEPFRDWTPVDILRNGGPVFINPKVKLLPGETLVLHYSNGRDSRLVVNRGFGSLKTRKARAARKKPLARKTIYDHLQGDDDW